jgi:TfoX/Sxy family transcriptional regulator of competence genes
MSGHRLARVYLQGGWRILVVTNMADDETGGTGRLSYDPAAAERVRQLLSGRSNVVEKKMVGGLSFLVNGNMCCGVTGMALMVRVGAESREQALRQPHVRPMLFAGRALSGFICIEPEGYAADDALASWVQRGLDFVSGLPGKPPRASS